MNLRNLAIWGVIVVVLIGLYSMVTGGGQKGANAGEITYSQLLSKVTSGQVKAAEIRGSQVTITDGFWALTPATDQVRSVRHCPIAREPAR